MDATKVREEGRVAHPGTAHIWEVRGLDVTEDNRLVRVRECAWCGATKNLPYERKAR